MKKQIRAAALALCTLMLFAAATGCGKQEKPTTEQPALETVEYSNLTDDDSRKQLSQLLSDAGIEEFRITALMDRVEQFNASVKSEWLTDGFESAAPTDTKYDPYEMQDEWTVANGSFPGYNCRITAFGLFSEWIAAGADQPEVQGEDSLFTDLETISANPDALCGDSTAKFCALFAPVNAVDSTEVEAQVKALQEGWAARGITFTDSKTSMISVIFHDKFSDEDNTLFVGQIIENPNIMVADKPIYFHAQIGELSDFSKKTRKPSGHDITIFKPIIEDITQEIHLLGITFNRVEKIHHTPFRFSRLLKITCTEMKIR